MNYLQAEKFLSDLAKLPRKEYLADPNHCDWYLKRLQFFLDLIGNPEKRIPHYIHITGTSGKGSVANYLHSILSIAGKRVGVSTSPHPTYITERWKINKREMTRIEFASLVNWLKNKYKIYQQKTPYDNLSLFEFTEALGLKFFANNKIDWVISEAGCGGRYDSTNIIPHKDVAVITNIGLDHVGIIGKNKKEIAYEKAGIIKFGNRVFTAETNPKILKVIKSECKKTKAKLNVVESKYKIIKIDDNGTDFEYKKEKYHLITPGEHQIINAILCIEISHTLKINNNYIKKGLKTAKHPLRFEIIHKKPLIILDGAHNPDKMKTTVATLCVIARTPTSRRGTRQPPGYYTKMRLLRSTRNDNKNAPLHILVGFSADKNIKQMVKQLSTLKPATITCSQTSTNDARPAINPNDLASLFSAQGGSASGGRAKIKISPNPIQAYKTIHKTLKTNDILLVTGSIYFSGQLRPIALSSRV